MSKCDCQADGFCEPTFEELCPSEHPVEMNELEELDAILDLLLNQLETGGPVPPWFNDGIGQLYEERMIAHLGHPED